MAILQGERVVLPRIADIVDSIREMGSRDGLSPDVYLLGTDISDAFHQVPLDERVAVHSSCLPGPDIHIQDLGEVG